MTIVPGSLVEVLNPRRIILTRTNERMNDLDIIGALANGDVCLVVAVIPNPYADSGSPMCLLLRLDGQGLGWAWSHHFVPVHVDDRGAVQCGTDR